MSKLFAIHAYEQWYDGLHGIENYEVIEAENFQEVEDYAESLSRDLIDDYNIVKEAGWYDEIKNATNLTDEDDEFYDALEDYIDSDIAYDIYWLKETNQSLEALNEMYSNNPEKFLKKYEIKE